jgi:hypothetical protein
MSAECTLKRFLTTYPSIFADALERRAIGRVGERVRALPRVSARGRTVVVDAITRTSARVGIRHWVCAMVSTAIREQDLLPFSVTSTTTHNT